MTAQAAIEAAITDATGAPARCTSSQPLTGGCIGNSRIVTLTDGRKFFVKSADGPSAGDMCAAEFAALERLRAAQAIRVPRPIACGEAFIVVEAFERGTPRPDWQEAMGRQLALLHRATPQRRYGFDRDNYLGRTPQPNAWSDDWPSFWRQHRLGWQLQLFARGAENDDALLKLGERLLERLDDRLGGVHEPAALLHGDLWSGNAAADEHGAPIIFDPASYYGHREAEIGMMRLFGGFGARCEAAYQEVWPLEPGAEERIMVYRLYHELNHLNLFGQAYYGACLSTLKQLV